MELQFDKKEYPCLRTTLSQTRYQEQTQEVRLPDGWPDAESVLGAWGQCVMRGKEWNGDTITVSGGIMGWILYAPTDGSAPKSLEIWIPVQMKWDMQPGSKEGFLRCGWLLRSLDARMLSARKLMVRGTPGVQIEALEPYTATVYEPGKLPESVELLRHSYPMTVPAEAGEKVFTVDEELQMPAGMEQILSCQIMPTIRQMQVLGNKAIVRGDGRLHMLYQDIAGQPHSWDATIAFSQFSELDRDYDKEADLTATMAVSGLETTLSEGKVAVKCGMVAQYTVWDRIIPEVVEDAYSPRQEVLPSIEGLQIPALLDRTRETVFVEGAVGLQPGKILDVTAFQEFPVLRKAGDLAEMELCGTFHVLYEDEAGNLRSTQLRSSGLWELPVSAMAGVSGEILQMTDPVATQNGDQLCLRMEVECEMLVSSKDEIPMVTGLELGSARPLDPQRPSLILRRAYGDSLWDLAKACGSTVNAIRQANGLEEEAAIGQMLLIPVS